MSSVSRAPTKGVPTPKLIVNGFSTSGYAIKALFGGSLTPDQSLKQIASGALTANTLKTVLSLTGAGSLSWLAAYHQTTTAKTIRVVLTLDGIVVFDSTSASGGTQFSGCNVLGAQSDYALTLDQVYFAKSCLLQIASSVTENNGITVATQYKN